ncbi:MAG: hypothetical protein GWO20_03890 [Candidatus Korarchaeota archaeon]|nr:hypothetical protein [Candidatus Korarchaeota archaeon]NIU82554.1 hypothetical protein [Candidatus Thorarchaeota archaeon]NIW13042.1 hypothetical protein [Candidatus Thorarchaeota archaeon]NIW51217.1 hypothetical protein [Candidatus Korarchaeota archaeon]
MINSRRKGKSSERIAEGLLRKLGYEILERNKLVEKGGEQAFEVDFIAKDPEGNLSCIEVKAGDASVSDIRHTYANSEMLNCKPIIVCKSLSNVSAEVVKKELGVTVIPFREYYLTEPEELELVVKSAIQEVLSEFGFFPLPQLEEIPEDTIKVLSALSNASSFPEAAKELDLSTNELGKDVGDLRETGVLPKWSQSFSDLRKFSSRVIRQYSVSRRIKRIEERLEQLEQEIKKIGENWKKQ